MLVFAENFETLSHIYDFERPGLNVEMTHVASNIYSTPFSLRSGGVNGSNCFSICMSNGSTYNRPSAAVFKIPVPSTKKVSVGFVLRYTGPDFDGDYTSNYASDRFGIMLLGEGCQNYAVALAGSRESPRLEAFVPNSSGDYGTFGSPNSDYEQISEDFCCPGYGDHFSFFEFEIDINNAPEGRGELKFYCDGVLVFEREDLTNADVSKWNSDKNDARSFIDTVCLFVCSEEYSWMPPSSGWQRLYIDSLYISTESGGSSDIIGKPFKVKTLLPNREGSQSTWSSYVDGDLRPSEEDDANSLQDIVFDYDGNDVNYLEGSSHQERELFFYSHDIDTRFSDIFAVYHRIAYKKAYTEEEEQSFSLLPISMASGREVVLERDKEVLIDDFVYRFLSAGYGVFPGLAVPWSWDLLETSQFGFEYHDKFIGTGVEGGLVFGDDVTVE